MPLTASRQLDLTPLQEGMVYHHLREGGGRGIDVVQVEVRLPEPPDVAGLRRAWEEVLAREEALRLVARPDEDGELRAHVEPSVELEFQVLDGASWPEAEVGDRLDRWLLEDELRGFELDRAPLMRVALLQLPGGETRMIWTMHHLLADGWSYRLVLEDVFRLHDEGRAGRAVEMEPRPRWADFPRWLRARDGNGDEAFWRSVLEGVRVPDLLPGERTPDPDRVPRRRRYVEDRLDESELAALRQRAGELEVTLNTLVQAAWALVLERYQDRGDVVFGAIRGGRAGTVPGAAETVGLFIQTLPVRVRVGDHEGLAGLARDLRSLWVRMREHEHASVADVQRWSGLPSGTLPFRSILNMQDPFWGDALVDGGDARWEDRDVVLHNRLVYPLVVAVNAGAGLDVRLEHDPSEMDPGMVDRLGASFLLALRSFVREPDTPLAELELVPAADRRTMEAAGTGPEEVVPGPSETVHGAISARAGEAPQTPALHFGDLSWSREELEEVSDRLARRLLEEGVEVGHRVGVAMERGPEMVAALLAVLKSGAAYVPVDPHYPPDRVRLMVEDAGLRVVLTQERLEPGRTGPSPALPEVPGVRYLAVDAPGGLAPTDEGGEVPDGIPVPTGPGDLAYVIYTSGSTGRPKGVMVEHGNVLNFFRGMDDAIELGEDPVWLAVTSISFDISVLELLWTLSRGVPVVLQPERERVLPSSGVPAGRRSATAPGSPVAVRRAAADPHAPGRTMDVSLFYFSAEGGEGEEPPPPGRNRYRLLLEGARIGDRGGLSAIWTPERHFHEFGGIYPNPSVAGAAVAAITERIGIRAGSVVLPLHDPVRVAEEWSVIDNLSDGRVGLSFASGWHDRDFIFRPDAYDDRKERMFSDMEVLRSLWRGEEVQREAPDGEVGVRVYPRPVQPELPVWVTAGGSPETFRRAGEVGANLLTHLLGQSPDELEEKIGIYREARRKAGHRGRGQVSLMIHTYVGTSPDEVLERVRTPFRNYLRTSVGLIRAMARGDGRDLRMAELTEADMEALLDHAFARYFETSALMGTMDQAVEMALVLRDRDVDELACLVDFGVEEEATLAGIERLPELQGRVNEVLARDASPAAGVDASRSPESDGVEPLPMSRQAADLPETAGEAIRRWGGTHMQCTPSMARLLLAEADPGLDRLRALLVGGEALPASLAATLREQLRGGRLHNMYGPTETTIWSATTPVDGALEGESVVPLGAPIRGTVLEVLDRKGRRAPAGVPGELVIGGAGVVRGYLDRPELTGERFLPAGVDGQRRYRTGDRAMWSFRGHLRFLGRMDTQVKIRGHRVELGEIEAALSAHPSVGAAVAHIPASSDGPEERLLAWVTPVGNADPPRADVLLAHLRERLPAIMVPFAITVLDAFPLTPNGKVDRSRLPPPFPSRDREEGKEEGRKELARSPSQMARAPSGAAATELERTISRIWKEVLQVDRVRPDDNFFDLGGHSLLTVRVHARLSGEVDVPVSITDLFRHPTVRALADHLSDDDSGEGDQGLSDAARRAAARRRAMGGGRRGRGRS